MRNRAKILKELALLQSDVKILKEELSQYPWDTEKPLFKINTADFSMVLKRSIINEINFETLTNWANAIECRDDLEFENEKMQEIIFELANPEINGEITKERLNEIVTLLERKYKCPCCGFYTLDDKADNTFQICPVCYWEDDGVQLNDPYYEGGANVVSLYQARENFKNYGAIEVRFKKLVRLPFETEK